MAGVATVAVVLVAEAWRSEHISRRSAPGRRNAWRCRSATSRNGASTMCGYKLAREGDFQSSKPTSRRSPARPRRARICWQSRSTTSMPWPRTPTADRANCRESWPQPLIFVSARFNSVPGRKTLVICRPRWRATRKPSGSRRRWLHTTPPAGQKRLLVAEVLIAQAATAGYGNQPEIACLQRRWRRIALAL